MKKNYLKFSIIIIFFLFYVLYLYWRARYTVPFHFGIVSLIAGSLLLLAEIVGFFESIIFYFTIWNIEQEPLPDVPPEKFPDVDIFIATYNETPELLYKTIVGCKNMKYPDKTKMHIYVCDDGNRPTVWKLCEELTVNYISREDHMHAKAGNLNHALEVTSSPYIITFDADMIPMQDFLMVTIPYFLGGEKIGFVQVPQNFYNADLFQYNLFTEENMPNEQELFSFLIQPGKARHNAVIYAGSNTVLSRAALDEIGGLVTGTITEDFATGMMIQSKGYKCKYVNSVHASGLSPESLEDLYSQRIRWGRGVIQTFKKFNPLFIRELNFTQKALYLSTFTYWYFGLWRLIFFMAPILFSVFNIVVLNAKIIPMICLWIPMFLLNKLVFQYFTKNVRSVSWSHIYDTILFPQLLKGVLKETFGFKMSKFKVTPKNAITRESYIQRFELVRFQIVLLIFSLIGIARIAFLYIIDGFQPQYVINLFWLIYNSYVFIMTIFFASERPKFRQVERFLIHASTTIYNNDTAYIGQSIDLSENSISFILKTALFFDEKKSYRIDVSNDSHKSTFTAKILRVDFSDGQYKYIFVIDQIEKENWDQYLLILYDRIPEFPKSQIKNHMIHNITTNIKKRQISFSPLNRKYPRIRVESILSVCLDDDYLHDIFVEDFNYQYVTCKERFIYNEFKFNPVYFGGNYVSCRYDEELTNKAGRSLHFYKVMDYKEEYGPVQFNDRT